MHELSLAESVVQLVEEAARADRCARVRAVRLEIGQLAAVETHALRFCFDAVTRGTMAEGARLEIVDIPGQGACTDCGERMQIAQLPHACPACGGYRIEVTGGSELRVRELEVE